MVLAVAAMASGQGTPAPTSWQKFPTSAVGTPPLPPPPPLQGTTVPPPSAPGSRVVLFTKPAGEVKPVQATDLDKKHGDENGKKAKTDDKDKKEDEKKKEKPPLPNPFVLRTDADLVADINADRDLASKQKDYEKELRKYEKGDTKEKPLKPLEVPVLETGPFQPTQQVKAGYAPMQAVLEPSYVVHRRLLFEEKNSERYGWDLGAAQPIVSTVAFFKDTLLWPSKLTSNLDERYDTSAGKCPPGSPVAYYLYPPNITFRGGLVGAGAIIGTAFLIVP